MRWGKWKLVREYRKPWELYDIDDDRTEMTNLSKQNASRKAEMVRMWEMWAAKHQVAFPERFNMYEFLRKKKSQQQPQKE